MVFSYDDKNDNYMFNSKHNYVDNDNNNNNNTKMKKYLGDMEIMLFLCWDFKTLRYIKVNIKCGDLYQKTRCGT